MRSAIIDALSAFRFVLGRPLHLFRFGFWPLIACVVMAMVFNGFAGVILGRLFGLPGMSGTVSLAIYMFLGGLPWGWFAAVFAVRWHRLVLAGEDRTSGFTDAFSHRVRYVFAWICLLDFLLVTVAGGLGLPVMNLLLKLWFLVPTDFGLVDAIWTTATTLAVVAVACAAYAFLLAQFALVFPLIAIDKSVSLGEIWRMSGGRRLRNVLTLFFVTFPPAAVLTVASMLLAKLTVPTPPVDLIAGSARATVLAETTNLIETASMMLLGFVIWIVTVASTAVALSDMYRAGAGRQSGHGAGEETAHG